MQQTKWLFYLFFICKAFIKHHYQLTPIVNRRHWARASSGLAHGPYTATVEGVGFKPYYAHYQASALISWLACHTDLIFIFLLKVESHLPLDPNNSSDEHLNSWFLDKAELTSTRMALPNKNRHHYCHYDSDNIMVITTSHIIHHSIVIWNSLLTINHYHWP